MVPNVLLFLKEKLIATRGRKRRTRRREKINLAASPQRKKGRSLKRREEVLVQRKKVVKAVAKARKARKAKKVAKAARVAKRAKRAKNQKRGLKKGSYEII